MAYSHFERLSAMDAAFLAVEDDCAHMHIGSVSLFESGPLAVGDDGVDIDRIRHLVGVQLHKTPRFRQKLAYVPVTAAPVWIDDASFHLDYHLRHTALPHPGDERQLQRLASRVLSQHLDRRRPLWELWVVEGIEGGRFALIWKIHHSMADGISGIDLARALMGPDPEFRPGAAPAWIPRPAPDAVTLAQNELQHRAGAFFDLLRRPAKRPARKRRGAKRSESVVDRLRQAMTAVGAAVEAAPPTPINVEIGPNRRFAWARTSFEMLGEIRRAADAKLNDVVLAIVTGAVRSFLQRRGCSVRELDFQTMIPVSVRSKDEQGRLGNRVSLLTVHLPLDLEDPLERLRTLCEHTRALKKSGQAEDFDMLSRVTELLLPSVAGALERAAARRSFGNMVVTNVPGPDHSVYLLGARLLETYPLVPLAGQQALNVAVLSYDGWLHWGVNADYDAIPDIADFVGLLVEEAEGLHKQCTVRTAASMVS